jgi:O-antigen/teichoic acid export membrane protein
MVQIAKLTKEVKFKKLMIAKLPSTLLGGAAGIGAAYLDFGVWSLVIQQLTDATAYSIQIWIQSKWRPQWVFDWQRVKEMFNFGGKLMIAGIINTIYKNIYEIIIGRFFSTAQVGFYTQANKIKQLPVQNISSALARVTFPVLSGIQDDNRRLKRSYKKIIKQIFFIISPLMIGGIVLGEPLFRFILTEKWLPAVPYFQWLCISGLFYPVNSYNLNILKVKGRSDLVLYLQIFKKTIITVGLLVLVHYSVLALIIFRAFFSIIAFFINSYYSGKLIKYDVLEQILDIWKFLFFSALMGIIVLALITLLRVSDFYTLIIGVALAISIYGSLIYYFEKHIMTESIQLIRKIFK